MKINSASRKVSNHWASAISHNSMQIQVSSLSTSSHLFHGYFSWIIIKLLAGVNMMIQWLLLRISLLNYKSSALIWICHQTSSSQDMVKVFAPFLLLSAKWAFRINSNLESICWKRAKMSQEVSVKMTVMILTMNLKETLMLLICNKMEKLVMKEILMKTLSLEVPEVSIR